MEAKQEERQGCFHCKKPFPVELLTSGEVIRPAMAELIRKRDPSWTPQAMLCPVCLNLFRSEYVEDALEEERGELSIGRAHV